VIPLRDDNPTTSPPIVTLALIAACTAVFLAQGHGDEVIDKVTARFAMVPARVFGGDVTLTVPISAYRAIEVRLPPAAVPEWGTLLTCTFLHGSWLHLIGNMWVLWIFGDNVEERFGKLRYLLFYLLSGVLASATHLLLQPSSQVPTVGASGAIAGVMGAYLLLYPHARVLTLIPLGFILQMVVVPAWVFLGLWFLLQVFGTLGGDGVGGVAWWAHIGGFVAGLVFAALLRNHHRLRGKPQVITLTARRLGGPRRHDPWP
jgi:membrane associated rhomboid family serine protease